MKVANYQFDELLEQVSSCATEQDVQFALKHLSDTNIYVEFWLGVSVSDVFLDFDIEELNYKFSDYHRSMAGQFLLSKTPKMIYEQVLTNSSVLQKNKRFQLKNMIEMLHSGEAKVLVACLKKNLADLYPKLTHELVCSVL